MAELTDYELLVKSKNGDTKARNIFFEKYKAMVIKNYKKCKSLFSTFHDEVTFDEYYAEAFIAFCKAINGIKIERITNPETWKIYIFYLGYLERATCDFIRDIKNKYEKNCSLETMVTYTDTNTQNYSNELKISEKFNIDNDISNSIEKNILSRISSNLIDYFDGIEKLYVKAKYYEPIKHTSDEICEILDLTKKEFYSVKRKVDNSIKNIVIREFAEARII